jgi:hypothetical protein
MTTEQAVNRQADHENLVRELARLLERANRYGVRLEMGPAWSAEVDTVLAKVQS